MAIVSKLQKTHTTFTNIIQTEITYHSYMWQIRAKVGLSPVHGAQITTFNCQ